MRSTNCFRCARRYLVGVGNILVTGGTGFIGRPVTQALVEFGHTVYVLSRSAPGLDSRAKARHTKDLFSADSTELNNLVAGIDSIVHLAWHVDPNDYLDADENWRCLAGSIRLALAARDLGVKHFVGIGTCIEYEQTDSIRTLATRLDPDTTYGAAKAGLFFGLREIFRESDTELAWCRLFFLRGEGEHPGRLVPHIRSQIAKGKRPHLRNPSAVRDYLDVSEAGKKIAKVADLRLTGAFNICSGTPISVQDLAIEIATEMGRLDLMEKVPNSIHDNELGPADRIVGLPASELEDTPSH